MEPMSTAPIDGRPFWAELQGQNGTFCAWLYYSKESGFMLAGFDKTQGSCLMNGWFPQFTPSLIKPA
jgi:hypothetical protein